MRLVTVHCTSIFHEYVLVSTVLVSMIAYEVFVCTIVCTNYQCVSLQVLICVHCVCVCVCIKWVLAYLHTKYRCSFRSCPQKRQNKAIKPIEYHTLSYVRIKIVHFNCLHLQNILEIILIKIRKIQNRNYTTSNPFNLLVDIAEKTGEELRFGSAVDIWVSIEQ